LAEGDHKHLGQILTYLTGLKADVIVWIAQGFREEHLSAISWLNENTVDPFAFFAVRLRLVQIGSSPLAPIFEVVARPNNWDRQLQVRAAEETNPQTERQRQFWAAFEARYPATRGELHGGRGTTRWRPVGAFGLVVARWFVPGSVGVFVRGERGMEIQSLEEIMLPVKAALEERLGVAFGRSGEAFSKSYQVDTSDEQNWSAAQIWLEGTTESYARALRDILGSEE